MGTILICYILYTIKQNLCKCQLHFHKYVAEAFVYVAFDNDRKHVYLCILSEYGMMMNNLMSSGDQ